MRVSAGGTRVTSVKITGPSYLNLMGPSVSYIGSLDTAQLMQSGGTVWALASDESVAAVSPATGRVSRALNYLGYDPGYEFGGSVLAAAGQGSVWLLAPLGRNEIVRVSMRTGKARSLVYPGGSCGQPCWQIYDAAGAIWLPTSQQILRIVPARMPD